MPYMPFLCPLYLQFPCIWVEHLPIFITMALFLVSVADLVVEGTFLFPFPMHCLLFSFSCLLLLGTVPVSGFSSPSSSLLQHETGSQEQGQICMCVYAFMCMCDIVCR